MSGEILERFNQQRLESEAKEEKGIDSVVELLCKSMVWIKINYLR